MSQVAASKKISLIRDRSIKQAAKGKNGESS